MRVFVSRSQVRRRNVVVAAAGSAAVAAAAVVVSALPAAAGPPVEGSITCTAVTTDTTELIPPLDSSNKTYRIDVVISNLRPGLSLTLADVAVEVPNTGADAATVRETYHLIPHTRTGNAGFAPEGALFLKYQHAGPGRAAGIDAQTLDYGERAHGYVTVEDTRVIEGEHACAVEADNLTGQLRPDVPLPDPLPNG